MPDVTINLAGYLTPFSVVVEPWACDFKIKPSDECKVIVHNPHGPPKVSMAVEDGALVIFVDGAGNTFRFVRGGTTELDVTVPTILLPGRQATDV